ncbi:hypothetical protein JMUB7535_26810 [Staphylococcus aureus]
MSRGLGDVYKRQDKKGSTTGRDYVFMETFGKTYDEFMSSRGEQNMEPVEKEMKKQKKLKSLL